MAEVDDAAEHLRDGRDGRWQRLGIRRDKRVQLKEVGGATERRRLNGLNAADTAKASIVLDSHSDLRPSAQIKRKRKKEDPFFRLLLIRRWNRGVNMI